MAFEPAISKKLNSPAERKKRATEEGASILSKYTEEAAAPAQTEPASAQNELAPAATQNSSIRTARWLALGSLVVSLVGHHYKREKMKNAFSKKEIRQLRLKPNMILHPLPLLSSPNPLRHTCGHNGWRG